MVIDGFQYICTNEVIFIYLLKEKTHLVLAHDVPAGEAPGGAGDGPVVIVVVGCCWLFIGVVWLWDWLLHWYYVLWGYGGERVMSGDGGCSCFCFILIASHTHLLGQRVARPVLLRPYGKRARVAEAVVGPKAQFVVFFVGRFLLGCPGPVVLFGEGGWGKGEGSKKGRACDVYGWRGKGEEEGYTHIYPYIYSPFRTVRRSPSSPAASCSAAAPNTRSAPPSRAPGQAVCVFVRSCVCVFGDWKGVRTHTLMYICPPIQHASYM